MDSSSSRRRSSTNKDHHHHRSKHHHDDDRRRSDDDHRRHDRERSRSVERNKRKERGESEERSNDKRARVYDDDNGRDKHRRFEEGDDYRESRKDRKYESRPRNDSGSVANGVATGPGAIPSRASADAPGADSPSPDIKVSSISKTNENKGVNSNRSHEVPGKSSTDGNAPDAAKTGVNSLDVLTKAKKALQMHKDLKERLKKIPLSNKAAGSNGEGSSKVGGKEVANSSSSTKGLLSVPAPSLASSPPGVMQRTSSAAVTSVTTTTQQSGLPQLTGLSTEKYEAVKRAQELAAKMGFRQDPEFGPLINMFPGQNLPADVTIQQKPSRAPVLRLDALGREIDEQGNVVNVSKANSLSTLKVNINKQKKDAFEILKPELEVDPDKNPHFDPHMGIDKNKLLRPKRMTFQFVEEGKWSKDAEIVKLKSQFGEAKAKELKVKQAQLAKAKSEPDINPNLIEVGERVFTKEKPKELIPDVEWWDEAFLISKTYGDVVAGGINEDQIKMDKINIYVEHPRPIEPPAEAAPPPPQPLKLTKKEQKKLRTQRRLAREKDRQEMIRLGVLEPPKPKVKMSNLMKVLGSEATQDPTRLEMEIRSAAAEREQAHIDRNISRKLTPSERREKKERKLFDDPNTLDTIVSVYKINDLSHPQARFKVDINAHENRLTGCVVISEGISVVVVEGGAKSIKRYGKLMLKRIDWTASAKKEEDDENDDHDDDEDKPVNKCVLVWQGSVAKPSFSRFSVQECRTETAARKFFSDFGVAHYWDLAVNFSDDTF